MKKPVIICLDDERVVLDSIKFELQKTFSEILIIEIAETTNEAFQLIEELLIDGFEIPIIISDWLMPDMKGDEFLIKVHSILPKTKKILLTGQAPPESIGKVVNNAQLYRFIPKPWNNIDLDLTVTEAFKSYYKELKIEKQQEQLLVLNKSLKTNVQEKIFEIEIQRDQMKFILDKTLCGFASTLINVISNSNNAIFEKSIRAKEIVKRLIFNLELENTWEYEIAALLSQLGCMNIDSDILHKYINNIKLDKRESNIFSKHPVKTYLLLSKIPQFENIANGILNIYDDIKLSNFTFEQGSQSLKISKILRFALDYDKNQSLGLNENQILDLFRNDFQIYDNKLIDTFESQGTKDVVFSNTNKIIAIQIKNLKVGMKLSANLKTKDGKVILNSESEITQSSIFHIIKMKKKYGLEEPIYVYN